LTDVLSNLFPVWLRGLRATALALLDESGNIVEANEGFLAPLPPQAAGGVAADFILDPPFFRWPQFPAGQDDVIYEGLIQIGAKEGFYRTISGRIYRMQTQFLLVAEIDISAFEKLNGELDSATREIEELRRQINRRNQALQKAQERPPYRPRAEDQALRTYGRGNPALGALSSSACGGHDRSGSFQRGE
jgi:hypothetical protein